MKIGLSLSAFRSVAFALGIATPAPERGAMKSALLSLVSLFVLASAAVAAQDRFAVCHVSPGDAFESPISPGHVL